MTKKQRARLEAAEEFCFTFMLWVGLGLLDDVPLESRKRLGDSWMEWADVAEYAHPALKGYADEDPPVRRDGPGVLPRPSQPS